MAKRPTSRASKKSPVTDGDLRLFRLPGLPEIQLGDDLTAQIAAAAGRARISFENGDLLVIAQKIISKAEGAVVRLATIRPSPQALALAERLKKDPPPIAARLQPSRRIAPRESVRIAE